MEKAKYPSSRYSKHFSDQIRQTKFTKRIAHWLDMAKMGQLRIDLAQVEDSHEFVGYCVTIIDSQYGEIESLYVDEAFRKMGIGDSLSLIHI